MRNRTVLWVLVVLVAIVAVNALGFVFIHHENPPIVSEPNWDSPQTRALAERACFDCHSNETKWPTYSYILGGALLVGHDVQEGRQNLNFSDWENVRGEGRSYSAMAEVIERGKMPPAQYTLLHPEARLTEAEQQQLLDGLQATLSN